MILNAHLILHIILGLNPLEQRWQSETGLVANEVFGDEHQLGRVLDLFGHLAFGKRVIDEGLGSPMSQLTDKLFNEEIAELINSGHTLHRISHHQHICIVLLGNLRQNLEGIKISSHLINVSGVEESLDMVEVDTLKVGRFQVIDDVVTLLDDQLHRHELREALFLLWCESLCQSILTLKDALLIQTQILVDQVHFRDSFGELREC